MAVNIKGIDHVGLTVADLDEAHRFLVEGLGATLLYELLDASALPLRGPQVEQLVGGPPGTAINAVRMYELGTGPAIELFHYTADEQRPAPRGSDFGFQHIAVLVDDLDAVVGRLTALGGVATADHWNMIGAEAGEDNRFCFVRAPFGALIELIACPSPQQYEIETGRSRWRPGRA